MTHNSNEVKKNTLRKIYHNMFLYWIHSVGSIYNLRNKKCIMNKGDKCLIIESTIAALLILIYFMV